ncbi:hypothetical protein DRE_02859 [Drechslerella stenobrocha 248]|uniref:Uncharacterized protein n=1 Tax=Drechslerella stenobrocha 248 TaxID=1043628 RepID=W7I7A7_9PEZI|nr:hypothetical protein DRE_02859 [Drechslerella stenobrocha 248]
MTSISPDAREHLDRLRTTSALVKQSFAEATNSLLDHGISIVQWGDQVLQHYGYPAGICIYDFVIQDSRIEEATRLLLGHPGIEQVEPPLAAQIRGVLKTSGYYFVSKADMVTPGVYLHIIAESLVHISSAGGDTAPRTSPFDPTREFLIPRLPQYCVSLVKCIQDYPEGSVDRLPARDHLFILLAAAVCRLPNVGGKILVPEELTESEESWRARQADAVREIKTWRLPGCDEPYRSNVIELFLSRSTG